MHEELLNGVAGGLTPCVDNTPAHFAATGRTSEYGGTPGMVGQSEYQANFSPGFNMMQSPAYGSPGHNRNVSPIYGSPTSP